MTLLKHDVAIGPTASARRARGWLARSWELVNPHGSGRVYPNFPDPELDDWARAYHAGNLERLTRVKAAYDPGTCAGSINHWLHRAGRRELWTPRLSSPRPAA